MVCNYSILGGIFLARLVVEAKFFSHWVGKETFLGAQGGCKVRLTVATNPIHLLRPKQQHTSSQKISRSEEMVPEIQAQIAKRLGVHSLSSGVTLGTFLVVTIFSPILRLSTVGMVGLILLVLVSFVMYLASRWYHDSFRVIGNLVTTYHVLGTILLCVTFDSLPWPIRQELPSLSITASWLLVYPVLVPNTMRGTVIGTALSVISAPLVIALLVTSHVIDLPSTTMLIRRLVPVVISAFPGMLTSSMLYRLGAQLKKERELGSYQLIDLIGKGGMGEVWSARHRLLTRKAAIKLILLEDEPSIGRSSSLRSRSALQRFEREAKATAQLRSPHTIEIYDFGVSNEGQFYYVMEFLEGMDLQRMVEKWGPIPPERAVFLLRQVCHSLDEAHRSGLVHRDIKPGNIFVGRFGIDDDFVKVLDFGLVAAMNEKQQPKAQNSLVTHENTILGTPAYIPPELAQGNLRPDGRADLYSLGCVAYFMLTGKPVFTADNAMKLLLAHISEKPPPLAEVAGVPEELAKVIHACLEKEPQHRPNDAFALSEMLRATQLEEIWTIERRKDWWEQETRIASLPPTVHPTDSTQLEVRSSLESALAATQTHSKLRANDQDQIETQVETRTS
jgi:eukaryotic-like serine/threonine-protein kinase